MTTMTGSKLNAASIWFYIIFSSCSSKECSNNGEISFAILPNSWF